MLNIYTSYEYAEEAGYIIEKDIDAIFNLRSANPEKLYYDEISVKILEEIEGMTHREKDWIEGKFGKVLLRDISTGGKGCLLATNYADFIIDAIQLGENCLKLLLRLSKNIEITIVYTEPLYIFDDNEVNINEISLKGYEASREMEIEYMEGFDE